MKALAAGLGLGIGLATVALIVLLYLLPGSRELELEVYVLVAGAMATLTAVLAARQAYPVSTGSAIADALKEEPREAVAPPELERTERVLTMATSASFDLHFRLRPMLREVAEQRLADRHGLVLDSGGEPVERLLGERLWEIVRPEREAPRRRFGPGLEPEELAGVIDTLERL
jgi:hypothetical protein